MFILLLSAVLSLLAQGTPALAYQTPEDALLQQQMQFYQSNNYLAPNTRRVRELGAAQEQQREAQHPADAFDPNLEQNAGMTQSSSSSAAAQNSSQSPAAPSSGTSTMDPAMLRLFQRLQRQSQTPLSALHANAVAERQEKPLAPTGMAGVAVAAVLVLAVVATLMRARRMQRK